VVSGLNAGKEQEIRFDGVRLEQSEHTLTATADAKEDASESNDDNNTLKIAARCKDANY
jgi:subtilase family serine protease